jgi:hypothetical protein
MTPTDKVLGQISAINTFIENFPMSILDMMHGKVYTSIFDFMIDVLVACGVNVNEIVSKLLAEIYGIEERVTEGIDGLYEKIRNGEIEIDNQNEFMKTLEESIKMIFMGLLSSIFTCSALPILPNRIMDGPNRTKHYGVKNTTLNALSNPTTQFKELIINKQTIDPMGLLDINPTGDDGRLLYAIEGKDKYYKRVYEPKTIIVKENIVSKEDGIVTQNKKEKKLLFTTFLRLNFDTIIGDNNNWSGGNELYESNFVEDKTKLKLMVLEYDAETRKLIENHNGSPLDLHIRITYTPYGYKTTETWDTVIKKGKNESEDYFLLSPNNEHNRESFINGISINGNDEKEKGDLGQKIWFYLSKEESSEYVDRWKNNGAHSLPWGEINENYEEVLYGEEIEVGYGEVYENFKETTIYEHVYEELTPEEKGDIDAEKFKRVTYVPTSGVNASSDEFIVCYDGLNPNMLYKTFDMNAFLWYVLHKGTKYPQIEYNHMMWDSRVSAAKNGIGRKNASEWNQWYNSKTGYTEEFKYFNSDITEESPLFPIIQLESVGTSENLFKIKVPSQRYLLPKIREYNIAVNNYGENEAGEDENTIVEKYKRPKHAMNASIYRFNWEYLENIQILQPKLLLVGLLNNLLGITISTIKSADVNFTKKLIEAKLSSAIKKVIESNDMEVEDCYMTFSNDEFNTMMEEMLLSRYNSTIYNGETSTVRVHDVNKYLSMIDQVSAGAKQGGNTTSLTKLVTEVTTTNGEEGSIDYGVNINMDGNLLKKLLWAIAMPILLSVFTPQLLLLIYINFDLMGITKYSDLFNQDFTKILNLLMNKIFGLLKSIIIFIKDKIVELLLTFLLTKILPLLLKYQMILMLERIEYWLKTLKAAIACLPLFKFKFNKVLGSIDSVDYADIISSQDTPESTSNC